MASEAGAAVARRERAGFRPCALIPTYNNPDTVSDVVDRVRAYLPDVVVIDDGSAGPGRAAVERIGAEGRAHVSHRAENGGKGAAVKTGQKSGPVPSRTSVPPSSPPCVRGPGWNAPMTSSP